LSIYYKKLIAPTIIQNFGANEGFMFLMCHDLYPEIRRKSSGIFKEVDDFGAGSPGRERRSLQRGQRGKQRRLWFRNAALSNSKDALDALRPEPREGINSSQKGLNFSFSERLAVGVELAQ
jgi:hypothetical protein